MLSKYISLPLFIISLTLGLLFVYLSSPKPTVIFVYPTPNNINGIEYKDKANTCFKFDANEVSCSKDAKTIPIQH